MRQQRIIGFGLDRAGRDEAARKRSADRLDSRYRSRWIPVVLIHSPGTEAYGMEIQVLGRGMMMVPWPRGALFIGTFGWGMGMMGMCIM